jgi:D-galactarolactone isomerase
MWATNWPHPGQAEPPSFEDLNRLAFEWMPDDTSRQRILVDNPAVLYGFDPKQTLKELS